MNILQIHKYYWPRDGASKYTLQLTKGLTAAGHKVLPFAMQEPESLLSPYNQYFVSDFDLADPKHLSLLTKIRAGANMFYNPQAVRNLKALLKTQLIDVAHVHNIYHHISPAILPVLKKSGIKIVMTVHDYHLVSPNYSLFHHGAIHDEDAKGWYWSCVKNKCVKNDRLYSVIKVSEMIWHHKFKKYFEKNVDQFIAPSQFMADTLVKHGYDSKKIIVIPNPIPESAGTGAWLRSGDYVGFAGRLSEEKGVQVLLAAAAQLPEITFKIAGSGPEEGKLKEFCQAQKLTNVEFVGFQTGQALEDFIAQAKLLVVPSIWYENGPLSVLEPMARGQIVLGSRIGGIPEMLPDEFLFAPGNVQELVAKINQWYQASVTDREQAGKELQNIAQSQHDFSDHLKKVLAAYF